MRFYTISVNNTEMTAVLGPSGEPVTLESLGVKVRDMNDLIRRYDEVKDRIVRGLEKDCVPVTEPYRILAPVPVPEQDLVCLGVNYREHILETSSGIQFDKKNDTVYFSKRANRCNDPDGVIPFYDFVDSLDYEVELGVIIGRDAFGVSAEEALDYVFGYTIINDVSARNIQRKHGQWYLGKSLDGYTPMGPCIVTKDEIGDIHRLQISCHVNGEERQNSSTGMMITPVEEAIAELSEGMTLKAGTIIATGTPGGVGMGTNPPRYLKPGDTVCCEISGIGKLTNIVEKK